MEYANVNSHLERNINPFHLTNGIGIRTTGVMTGRSLINYKILDLG
ncbi:908_t:CDS:2 [Racocetra fulgida]|uniref:908_t:CDS:1 n=1 Tax=Racocetra fulgida TaxID=60492 RepID=A0A9N9APY6_9GLOM|nr:908_t:CDS:2 [Racocetra fulgida]